MSSVNTHPDTHPQAADLPWWQPGEDSTLQCVQVREETHDVKTFVFRAEPPRRFHYQPGQFITLELESTVKASTAATPCPPAPRGQTASASPSSAFPMA
jgi:hypothetical protein